MKLALVLCIISASHSVCAQRSTLPNSSPVSFTAISVRMFSDTARPINFSLKVSWIPGATRAGVMRYQILGRPGGLSEEERRMVMNEPVDTEKFIKRIAACKLDAILYDGDGFILRTVPKIIFTEGLDVTTGRIISLSANDSIDMSAAEYRTFQSWNMEWNCPLE